MSEEKHVSFSSTTSNAPSTSAASAAAKEKKKEDKHWPEQILQGLDVTKLNPLSPVVMHRQATINIGIQTSYRQNTHRNNISHLLFCI